MQVKGQFRNYQLRNATTVVVPPFVSNEHWREEPDFALAASSGELRPAVVLDKRRADLSDRVSELPARTTDCGQICRKVSLVYNPASLIGAWKARVCTQIND